MVFLCLGIFIGKFNLSFSRVSMLFLNSWRVSVVPYYVTTHAPSSYSKCARVTEEFELSEFELAEFYCN
jgi:hypothetical protein